MKVRILLISFSKSSFLRRARRRALILWSRPWSALRTSLSFGGQGKRWRNCAAAWNPHRVSGVPLAVELSDETGIELLWDRPQSDPPTPWNGADGGRAWRLAYDPDAVVPVDDLPASHYGVLMVRQVGAVVAVMVVIGVSCGPGSVTSESLRIGRGVYGDRCSSCHGSRGQGGVGPSLSDVLETWPDCADQQEWIALGSERWKTEHGPTYGAKNSPVTKVMPEHATTLTSEEIATVAAFERVQYGGGDEASELEACGVADE